MKTYVVTVSSALVLLACGQSTIDVGAKGPEKKPNLVSTAVVKDSVLNIEAKGLDRKPDWRTPESFTDSVRIIRREALPEQQDLLTQYLNMVLAAEAAADSGKFQRIDFIHGNTIREVLLNDYNLLINDIKRSIDTIKSLDSSLKVTNVGLRRSGANIDKCIVKIQFTNNTPYTVKSIVVRGETTFKGLLSKISYLEDGSGFSGYPGKVKPSEKVEFDLNCSVTLASGEDLLSPDLTTIDTIHLSSAQFDQGEQTWVSVNFNDLNSLNAQYTYHIGLIELIKK